MQRFFLTKDCRQKNKIHIHDSAIVHQMNHVMRAQLNDEVICLFNDEKEYLSKIISLSKKTVQLEILRSYTNENELSSELILIQALPKSKEIWERVLQKAVELGVSKIIPLKNSRVTAKYPSDSPRIQNIIREAAEQSERGVLPELLDPVDIKKLSEYLKSNQGNVKFFLADSHKNKEVPLLLSLINQGMDSRLCGNDKAVIVSVGIVIGPEGGFSREEAEFLNELGIVSVSLGSSILRVETAAVSSLAILAQGLKS